MLAKKLSKKEMADLQGRPAEQGEALDTVVHLLPGAAALARRPRSAASSTGRIPLDRLQPRDLRLLRTSRQR